MTSNFDLRCEPVGASLVLWAGGEFDFGSRRVVLDAAVPALMRGQAVILDLHNVTFIDAGGLGTLVACAQAAVNSGAKFTLRNAQGRVAYLLKLTGVTDVISTEQVPTRPPLVVPTMPRTALAADRGSAHNGSTSPALYPKQPWTVADPRPTVDRGT